jgi:ankyrin repeat protein
LEYPGCVANPKNNDGDTPLHLAVKLTDEELEDIDDDDAARLDAVDVLLEKMMEGKVNLGYKHLYCLLLPESP